MSKNNRPEGSRASSQGQDSGGGSTIGSNRRQPVVTSSSPFDVLGLAGMFKGDNRQNSRQSDSNPVGEIFTRIAQETQNTVQGLTSYYNGLARNNTPSPRSESDRPPSLPGPAQPTSNPSTNPQNKSPKIYMSDLETIESYLDSTRRSNKSDLLVDLKKLMGSVREESGVENFKRNSSSTKLSDPADAIDLEDGNKKEILNKIIAGIETWDISHKGNLVQAINDGRNLHEREIITSISELKQTDAAVIATSQHPVVTKYTTKKAGSYYSAVLTPAGNNPTTSQNQSPIYPSDIEAMKMFLGKINLQNAKELPESLSELCPKTDTLDKGVAINFTWDEKTKLNGIISQIKNPQVIRNDPILVRKMFVDKINMGRRLYDLPEITGIDALTQNEAPPMQKRPGASPSSASAAAASKTRGPQNMGGSATRR